MLLTQNKCIVVIVAYNPIGDILSLISNLGNFDKLIIDNSPQKTDWLVDECQNLGCAYWHYDNVGIAQALNLAAKYAIELRAYSHLISLDQDSNATYLIIDDLIRCYNDIENNHLIATVGPKHISDGVTVNVVSEEFSDSIFGLQSANLINLSIWKNINGFNEDLFIDMVDTDYYIRARVAGYTCITCNYIHMLHKVGDEVKEIKIFGKYIRAFNHSYIRKYYQSRNFIYVYLKYRKIAPEVKYFLKIILVMPFTILIFESDKIRKLLYYFRGIKDLFFNRMGKLID